MLHTYFASTKFFPFVQMYIYVYVVVLLLNIRFRYATTFILLKLLPSMERPFSPETPRLLYKHIYIHSSLCLLAECIDCIHVLNVLILDDDQVVTRTVIS